MHTESKIFACIFHFFIFFILSYQNACYECENAENRTWSEFFYDGRKFRRQCVNVIDTTWGRIYFFTSQCAMTLTHVRHETWCHLVICFIDTPWRVSMVCTLLWSIASSIFKERPTLGFDCSVYSSVGSFLIGSPYCKLFTGFRLYRLSPSQCCHYVQLLWWPQVLGLSRFIRIDNKLLFVNCCLSLSLSLSLWHISTCGNDRMESSWLLLHCSRW